MRRVTLIVLVLAAAIAVLVHLLNDRDAPGRAGRDEPSIEAEMPERDLPADRPAAEPEDPAAPVEPAAPEEEPTHRGRVTGERGGHVRGVHIVLRSEQGQVVVTTAADGSFQTTERLHGAVRAGFATWPASENSYRTTPLPVFPEDGEALRFRGIAGRVVDLDGESVEEGFVVVRKEGDGEITAHAPLAPGGWFAVYGVEPGVYRLTYKRRIYGGEQGAVEGGGGIRESDTDILLRLGAGDTIEGIVFDPGGRPAKDVYLRAELGAARTGATTNADGWFRVEKLKPGATYRLTIWATGFLPESRDVPVGAKDVRFRLQEGLDASGRILGPDGKPAQVPQLLVATDDGRSIRCYPASDANGRFLVVGLPEGPFRMWAVRGGKRWVWRARAGDSDVVLRPTVEDIP
jgi:hypothetical protein